MDITAFINERCAVYQRRCDLFLQIHKQISTKYPNPKVFDRNDFEEKYSLLINELTAVPTKKDYWAISGVFNTTDSEIESSFIRWLKTYSSSPELQEDINHYAEVINLAMSLDNLGFSQLRKEALQHLSPSVDAAQRLGEIAAKGISLHRLEIRKRALLDMGDPPKIDLEKWFDYIHYRCVTEGSEHYPSLKELTDLELSLRHFKSHDSENSSEIANESLRKWREANPVFSNYEASTDQKTFNLHLQNAELRGRTIRASISADDLEVFVCEVVTNILDREDLQNADLSHIRPLFEISESTKQEIETEAQNFENTLLDESDPGKIIAASYLAEDELAAFQTWSHALDFLHSSLREQNVEESAAAVLEVKIELLQKLVAHFILLAEPSYHDMRARDIEEIKKRVDQLEEPSVDHPSALLDFTKYRQSTFDLFHDKFKSSIRNPERESRKQLIAMHRSLPSGIPPTDCSDADLLIRYLEQAKGCIDTAQYLNSNNKASIDRRRTGKKSEFLQRWLPRYQLCLATTLKDKLAKWEETNPNNLQSEVRRSYKILDAIRADLGSQIQSEKTPPTGNLAGPQTQTLATEIAVNLYPSGKAKDLQGSSYTHALFDQVDYFHKAYQIGQGLQIMGYAWEQLQFFSLVEHKLTDYLRREDFTELDIYEQKFLFTHYNEMRTSGEKRPDFFWLLLEKARSLTEYAPPEDSKGSPEYHSMNRVVRCRSKLQVYALAMRRVLQMKNIPKRVANEESLTMEGLSEEDHFELFIKQWLAASVNPATNNYNALAPTLSGMAKGGRLLYDGSRALGSDPSENQTAVLHSRVVRAKIYRN